MKPWQLPVLGCVLGLCFGVFWAFDFDTERLLQGASRVVISSLGGLGIVLVAPYVARVRKLQWR